MFVLSLVGSLSRSSAKLAASFVLVIAIMVLAFAYKPELISWLQDWIEIINDKIRTPGLLKDKPQGLILYRSLVNEATIFGILMTLIARTIIEIVAWAAGNLWKAMHAEN